MSTTFVHSVKVPRLYKEAAKTVKKVLLEGASFKSLVFKQNHPNVQGIYALVSETLQHCKELQSIIDNTKILIENPRFDPWLARVLITELLWGKKILKSEAKPVVTVLNYKEKLQQAVQNSDAPVDPCDKKKVRLPRYVRINTLLTSIDEALNAFYDDGWNLLPRCDNYTSHLETTANLSNDSFIQDFHIPEVLIFPFGTKFHDHPGYLNGKLLLQDKASCLSAFLLNPKPGSEILDLCAAPGMKTTHLAAIINNSGKIYAVEMNDNRFQTLCDFVTHTNANCVETIQADALTISPDQYPNVKYILVDPSCSGSGMDRFEIRKQDKEDLYHRLSKLQSLQSMILGHALLRFPNVKKVVYSTCSIYPEENECVVDEALQKVGGTFTLVNLRKKLKHKWINFGSSEYSYNGDKCLYALPQKDLCNGFFLAMFKRKTKTVDEPNKVADSINEFQASMVMDIDEKANDNYEVPLKKGKKEKTNSNKVKDSNDEYQAPKVNNGEEENNESYELLPKKVKKEKKKKKENECNVETEEQ